ncbi:MAG TPA: hypothetical protein VFW19_16850 [Allosphingosinicella sp.]|nr:hypothetical protein [Allosphingosinicella sp.]
MMKLSPIVFRLFTTGFLLCAACVVVGGFLGWPVFSSNIRNDKKPEVVGCYQSHGTTVFRVDLSAVRYGDGHRLAYQLISDKMGLALLPARLLEVDISNPANPKIISPSGRQQYIPYDSNRATLTFSTKEGASASFAKAKCL